MYIVQVCAILHAIFLADYFIGNRSLTLLQVFIPMFVYLGYVILSVVLDVIFPEKEEGVNDY